MHHFIGKLSLVLMTLTISLFSGWKINEYLTNNSHFLPAPYIVVESDTYAGMKITDYLSEFNRRGEGKLFSFNSGLRPIIIRSVEEVDGEDSEYINAGTAYYNAFYCYIEVSDKLPDHEMRLVVIHELLHCFNIGHVPKEVEGQGDLMEPVLGLRPTEQNIDYYARLLYEKRGLRP